MCYLLSSACALASTLACIYFTCVHSYCIAQHDRHVGFVRCCGHAGACLLTPNTQLPRCYTEACNQFCTCQKQRNCNRKGNSGGIRFHQDGRNRCGRAAQGRPWCLLPRRYHAKPHARYRAGHCAVLPVPHPYAGRRHPQLLRCWHMYHSATTSRPSGQAPCCRPSPAECAARNLPYNTCSCGAVQCSAVHYHANDRPCRQGSPILRSP